jgi:peptidyl-prolyl cis-trans isomerase C
MSELRPEPYEWGTKAEPVSSETVLTKMMAEKAMVIDGRRSGMLQNDEEIRTSVKQVRDRNLANLLLQKYLASKQADLMVTDAEIEQALKTDPKLDRTRAQAMLQRAKANRILDEYYGRLYKKLNVQKVSASFARAAEIHQRLLYRPKEPRDVGWIQNSQVRNELTPEEKNMLLATYSNGKVTLYDWLVALCDIVPPGRPKDLHTAQGVERLLDRALRMPIFVAEAESLGLDKDESIVGQVRQYEDMRLLGAAQMSIYEKVKEPTEQEIVTYFNNNKELFGTPKRLKIDQIWCEDLKTAHKVKAELDGGKDFDSVKKEFSLQKESQPFDTSSDAEGIFFKDLWQGAPNEVVGPVKGFYSDGVKWRIVKILEKKPAELKEYSPQDALRRSDMKDQIKSRAMDEKRNALLAKYRQELLEKYPHKIYADRIKDIDLLSLEKEAKIVSEEVRREPKTELEEARKDISSLQRFVRTQALHTLPKAFLCYQ